MYVVPRIIQVCQFSGNAHFFCFRQEIPFLGKFGPKIKIVSLN